MEIRGELADKRSKGRPAIGRRSCDQCRSRKIGCDRGSPCSLCVAAKLECTFSAVVSQAAATPKQRVLISAQYEQKIDGIARDIDEIKALLQGISVSSNSGQSETESFVRLESAGSPTPLEKRKLAPDCAEIQWDHSGNIIDFIKAVVNDRAYTHVEAESVEVLSSLRSLAQALEDPRPARTSCLPQNNVPPMPPLDAVLAILRWAKDHGEPATTPWIPDLLSRQRFTDICQRVYFGVDDYSDIDSILANGYLSYTFFEHVAISGRKDYMNYTQRCRKNLEDGLERLPLLLPASMDTIAALTLGVYNAIENSDTTRAWSCISVASNLCQTLGYHRFQGSKQLDESNRAGQERLFWTVYKLEKGLSFRLGRSSYFRDDEITLLIDPSDEPVRIARIQGRIYDQLYSIVGLSRSNDERGTLARILATELRDLISETLVDAFATTGQSGDSSSNQARKIYLQSNLVCKHSLLAQVLRAVPSPMSQGSAGGSDECVKVARECLHLHDQCIRAILEYENDPFMMKRYITGAILHTPFVSFNILFTRAVQLLDAAELDRLDRFAASLQPGPSSSESPTHPYRLYRLLCQAARLYFNLNAPSSVMDQAVPHNMPQSSAMLDFAPYGMVGAVDEAAATGNELSEWYYENQQIMSLLNDNILY